MVRASIAGALAGVTFAGAALYGAAPAFGSVPEPPPQSAKAPGPGVARISAIDKGSVVIQRGDDRKEVAGTVNAPLLPGDFISTSDGTRAEVQLDGYAALRLDSNVQARIVENEPDGRQLQLAAGTVELAILHEGDAAVSIDTPSVTVRATQPGDYRISVDPDGWTEATARTGAAQILTPAKTYDLNVGTTLVASGSASAPTVTDAPKAVAFDAFDDFNATRDRVLLAAIDAGDSMPPSIAGYDDLSKYGTWVNVAPYGNVWTPGNVGPDWAPYRNGQWSWIGGYGWTWVSYEPWGWVPYHYGNWIYSAPYGWCWVPPAPGSALAWQPALVTFYGSGYNAGWTFSFNFGYFAWAPLWPSQMYYAWYPGWNQPFYAYAPPAPPVWQHPIAPRKPVVTKPVKTGRPNPIPRGLTAVDARSFHEGNFSHPIVDAKALGELTPIHGTVPLEPSQENRSYSRASMPAPAPVQFAPIFFEPRFAASTPAIARAMPVSAWSRFSSERGRVPPGGNRVPSKGIRPGEPVTVKSPSTFSITRDPSAWSQALRPGAGSSHVPAGSQHASSTPSHASSSGGAHGSGGAKPPRG